SERRRSRRPAIALGRVILILAIAVAALVIAANLGSFNVAVTNPTPSPAGPTAPPPSPTVPPTIPPTTAPTTAPTAPGPTDIPVAVLQKGAWDAVQAVQAAAAAKDL